MKKPYAPPSHVVAEFGKTLAARCLSRSTAKITTTLSATREALSSSSMAPTARSAGYRQTTSSTSSSHNLRSEAILSTKCRLRPSGDFHSSSPSRLSSAMTSTRFPEPKRTSISTSAATGYPPCTSSPGLRSPRPSPTSIVRKTLV